ncbi:MAG: BTAD domain-containing putative transcriptional regulator [Anaerolineae bacterium]
MTTDYAVKLVEGSSEAAFALDGRQRVLAWNSRAEALLGIGEDEAIGRYCYDLLVGETSEGRPVCGPGCAAAGCFWHGRPYEADLLMAAKRGGAKAPVHVSSIVLPGQVTKGDPMAIVLLRPLVAADDPGDGFDPGLSVYALGSLQLYSGARALPWWSWPRRKSATLLKYLLARRGHSVHREELAEALWPEAGPGKSQNRLKVLVHSLRRGLEPNLASGAHSAFVATEGDGYRLVTGPQLWVDVDRFVDLAREGESELGREQAGSALDAFEAAVLLYRGHYLEEDPFDDWLAPERERLRELYLSVLTRTAALYAAAGDPDSAIAACRQALSVDACRESVHRSLMNYLSISGQRSEALRQYEACRRVLRHELDVEPLPETTYLYERIVAGRPISTPASKPLSTTGEPSQEPG